MATESKSKNYPYSVWICPVFSEWHFSSVKVVITSTIVCNVQSTDRCLFRDISMSFPTMVVCKSFVKCGILLCRCNTKTLNHCLAFLRLKKVRLNSLLQFCNMYQLLTHIHITTQPLWDFCSWLVVAGDSWLSLKLIAKAPVTQAYTHTPCKHQKACILPLVSEWLRAVAGI